LAFRGHFEHSLDAKNRLSIPARFRAAFADGLVLSKDSEACVAVWTPQAHDETVSAALSGLNPLGVERKRVARYHRANSWDVEMDKASRVTIPPQLLAHAGIEREVVVAGVGTNLELWDKESWDAEQASLDEHIGELTEGLGNPS
jgi:MraZ protein